MTSISLASLGVKLVPSSKIHHSYSDSTCVRMVSNIAAFLPSLKSIPLLQVDTLVLYLFTLSLSLGFIEM